MTHLVLVGPMGAGKSSVGRRVAERLDRTFVDTDDLVVAATGRKIPELFDVEGEPGFRERERVAVAEACATRAPAVIGCGGGAVLDPENRAAISHAGIVIWLDASPAVLASRVEGSTVEGRPSRPLLADGDAVATLERLRSLRAAAYDSVSDLRLDTDGQDIAEVVDAVVAAFSAIEERP